MNWLDTTYYHFKDDNLTLHITPIGGLTAGKSFGIPLKSKYSFQGFTKFKSEIYKYFKPNGKSIPYHFIRKYIDPLIKKELLEYTIPNIKSSKLQKIVYKK